MPTLASRVPARAHCTRPVILHCPGVIIDVRALAVATGITEFGGGRGG